MSKEAYHGPLEKVDDCCYRIPKSYKPGMRVDGLIFADEKLIEQIRADQAPEQVANVAFLPGIQHASLAMPDIHWGYGFCIGGVCATDPDEGGVISPGGVGYDINCLPGSTCVLHAHGYTRSIGEMFNEWKHERLTCFNLRESKREATSISRWFGQKPRAQVLRLKMESGDEIMATSDHPFWTPSGMIPLGKLQPKDRVAVHPFEGIPFEMPTDDVIVSEEGVKSKWVEFQKGAGNGIAQVLNSLKSKQLLPLCYSSAALPYLCKILGFVFGDASIHFEQGRGKGIVWFYGRSEDLEDIRADLKQLGITPSRIYRRQRTHKIRTLYSTYEFERTEESFKVTSSGFALLLACLGAPVGKKTCQDYSFPKWLLGAPRWQKRLFLAGLFGAELTTPATISGHGTLFGAPNLSMQKHEGYVESGREFLNAISNCLGEFGVRTQSIIQTSAQEILGGSRSVRLQLVLSPKMDSLIPLWSRVGYEYNRKRTGLGMLAIQYLKFKRNHLLGIDTSLGKTNAASAAQEHPNEFSEGGLTTFFAGGGQGILLARKKLDKESAKVS